jgi:hypothetical protein
LNKRLSRPRTKKLLLRWAMGWGIANAHAPDSKSFFASFCSQREVLPSVFYP